MNKQVNSENLCPRHFMFVFEYILNYKRNPSVTSRGNYGKQNEEMKIY